MAKKIKAITPRSENYSQWYNDIVLKADLAENAAVRGCMVIKPYGFAIWERMRSFSISHLRRPVSATPTSPF